VRDGGFESAVDTGNFCDGGYTGSIGDGWNVTQGAVPICNSADWAATAVPFSGNQFAYLDEAYSLNTLTQTLATIVGQSYLVTFYLADTAPNPVTVDFGSQVLLNGTAPTVGTNMASDYALYSYNVTATSASTSLSFTGQYNNGVQGPGTGGGTGTLLDNVDVTAATSAVPEPSTLGFTALGGLALLSLRRKRA
jgi:hypothetical protein